MNGILRPLLLSFCCLLLAPGLRATAADRPEPPHRIVSAFAPSTDAEFTRVTSAAADERTEARRAFASLDARDQYVEGNLAYEDLVTLPVGIRKKIGENTIEMAVAKAVFLSDKAELTVYIRMTIPVADVSTGTTERVLYFGADQVGVTRNGGLTGDFHALLLGDFVLPLRNYSIILRGGVGMAPNGQVSQALTYAEFTCGSGFKEAKLVADVVFPREVLVPVDRVNYQEQPGRVTGHFEFTSSKGLHDVVIDNISSSSAFAIQGISRFAFELDGLAIDLSQSANPLSFVSPEYFPQTASPTWEGVYLRNLKVILPPEFRKKNSTQRIAIQAQNVLVDRLGFSGRVGVGSAGNGPLSLEEGDASGWKFAVDRVDLDIWANHLRGGSFAGRIALPVSGENSQAFSYKATIDPASNYSVSVSNLDQVDFSFMRAKATLYPGSEVQLNVVNDKFKPRAILHGSMGIYANLNDTGATPVNENGSNLLVFRGIAFENLVLQTETPKLSFGSIAYEQSGKMALFPVVINSFNVLPTDQTHFAVGIGVSVNLMSTSAGKGFSGTTLVTFEAEENAEGRWKFVGLKKPVDILLAANVSAFTLDGRVSLYDNATERGFQGGIHLTIQKPKEITVCASAKFGYNVPDSVRYW